jgi:transposase
MSKHPITAAADALRRIKTTKPAGTYSIQEIAKRLGVSVDSAKSQAAQMIEAGIAIPHKGNYIDGAGQVKPCVYYEFRPSNGKK